MPVIELADCNIAVLFDGHFEPDTELSNVDVLVEMNRDAFGDPMAAPAAVVTCGLSPRSPANAGRTS